MVTGSRVGNILDGARAERGDRRLTSSDVPLRIVDTDVTYRLGDTFHGVEGISATPITPKKEER